MRAWILLLAAGLGVDAEVHFHHLQLNVRDPETAVRYYTARFTCERAGADAVRVDSGWLYFRKVKRDPETEIRSAIWHFGWGAEDMRTAYAAQLEKGTVFSTPLTDISDLTRTQGFFYAYARGPEGELIELNTAAHYRFGHVHLLSADPVAAGQWWVRHFGVRWRGTSAEPRFYRGRQVGPAASFFVDGVNVIIFPAAYFPGMGALAPTQGRVVDHVGLGVEDLAGTLRRLRRDGVRVLQGAHRERGMRVAMIEGPDRLAIQLVETKGR